MSASQSTNQKPNPALLTETIKQLGARCEKSQQEVDTILEAAFKQNGNHLNAPDAKGDAPIHAIMRLGNLKALNWLVGRTKGWLNLKSIDIKLRTKADDKKLGETPLQLAVQFTDHTQYKRGTKPAADDRLGCLEWILNQKEAAGISKSIEDYKEALYRAMASGNLYYVSYYFDYLARSEEKYKWDLGTNLIILNEFCKHYKEVQNYHAYSYARNSYMRWNHLARLDTDDQTVRELDNAISRGHRTLVDLLFREYPELKPTRNSLYQAISFLSRKLETANPDAKNAVETTKAMVSTLRNNGAVLAGGHLVFAMINKIPLDSFRQLFERDDNTLSPHLLRTRYHFDNHKDFSLLSSALGLNASDYQNGFIHYLTGQNAVEHDMQIASQNLDHENCLFVACQHSPLRILKIILTHCLPVLYKTPTLLDIAIQRSESNPLAPKQYLTTLRAFIHLEENRTNQLQQLPAADRMHMETLIQTLEELRKKQVRVGALVEANAPPSNPDADIVAAYAAPARNEMPAEEKTNALAPAAAAEGQASSQAVVMKEMVEGVPATEGAASCSAAAAAGVCVTTRKEGEIIAPSSKAESIRYSAAAAAGFDSAAVNLTAVEDDQPGAAQIVCAAEAPQSAAPTLQKHYGLKLFERAALSSPSKEISIDQAAHIRNQLAEAKRTLESTFNSAIYSDPACHKMREVVLAELGRLSATYPSEVLSVQNWFAGRMQASQACESDKRAEGEPFRLVR